MRKILLPAFALALMVGTPSFCPAQDDAPAEMKPVATISFSGYGEVLKDIEHIGKLAGNPRLGVLVEGLVSQFIGNPQGLVGLDKERPWGIVVRSDGQEFPSYAFVPVTDLKALLEAVEPRTGPASDIGDGVLKIDVENRTLYVKQQGGWAFVGVEPHALADLPDDPLPALDKLNESYDLAARIWVRNLPPDWRQTAQDSLETGIQMGMERIPNEGDDEYAIRGKLASLGKNQFNALLNELDTLLLGLSVDREASTTYLDGVVTAVEGTRTAEQIGSPEDLKTDFAGLMLPDADVSIKLTSKIAESDMAQFKLRLGTSRKNTMKELERAGLEEEGLERAKKMVGELFDVLEATVDSGRADTGIALWLDPDAFTMVAGAHVTDSTKLENFVRQMAEQAIKDDPKAAKAIKLDVEEYEGFRFHTMALSTRKLKSKISMLPKLVGKTLNVVIGVGEESVYLAAGENAAATLKRVIDESKAKAGTQVPPFRVSVAGTPVARLAGRLSEGMAQLIAGMVAGVLAQSKGKDHLTVTVSATPDGDGAKIRVEMEEGVLKVAGALPVLLITVGLGGPGGPGGGFPGGPGF